MLLGVRTSFYNWNMSVVRVSLTLVAVFLAVASATVYFEDSFLDGNIDKWHKSEADADKLGVCEFSTPKEVYDKAQDGGIKTTEDAKFYRYAAAFSKPISNKDKEMCVQFSVKHEQNIDCGGGYVKLMGEAFKAAEFTGDTDYEIMFGPDICGYDTRKVHVIFSHNGKNHLVKDTIECKTDTLTHLYTLIVRPDNTFEVLVDRASVKNGSLVTDFDMVLPKMIDDPEDKKPEDWVNEAEIPDPEDTKPEDWDQPKTIVDEKAKKPDDWDEETDGEWEAPMIDNPEYKGEWKAKMIPNPAYKGEWKAKQIPNPDYKDEPELYARTIANIGLDLWQVKSGTIFDDFVVSDDLAECEARSAHWKTLFEAEKVAKEKKDAEEAAKAQKEAEEMKKKQEEEKAKKAAESEDKEADEEEDKDDDEKLDDVEPEAEEPSTKEDEKKTKAESDHEEL